MSASNAQLLAAIDARHRLTPEQEAVLERAVAFVKRADTLPLEVWPVIEYDDLAAAVKAMEEVEGRG